MKNLYQLVESGRVMKNKKTGIGIRSLCVLVIGAFTVFAVFVCSACSNAAGNNTGTELPSAIDTTSAGNTTSESAPTQPAISAEPTASTQQSASTQQNGEPVNSGNIAGGSSTSNEDDPIRMQIKHMGLDEKIGQMFIVGFKGTTTENEIKTMIQKYHVGGIILFRNNVANPSQLLSLVNSLKLLNSKNKLPLFLSVDEEGGRISRLPDQLVKLPSNQDLGKINEPQLSFHIGGVLAYELKAFGFNMDFAPVVDIFSNPKNTVIGDRSFGTEPDIVSRLGVQTMKGLQEGGVVPVVKHFPGHGDTLVDSHVGLPTVEYELERLKSFEFKPFQAAIENKADVVMIAHILMKAIDPKNPASMSKTMITDILRNQMGFEGVVATDDMTMGAILENYKMSTAVVKSVEAGCDILLVCHGFDNQLDAFNALKTSVRNGTIAEKRIDESVYRILKLKRQYAISDKRSTSIHVDEINNKINDVLNKR